MKQAINIILFLILLSVIAAMLFMPLAHATGQPEPVTTASNATSHAKAGAYANSAIDLSLMNSANGGAGYGGAGFGGSVRQDGSYSLAAPASAAPLPTGLCPKGDSESFSIIWGLVSWAKSSTRTEMECLDKVLAMLRDTAPKPVVINYVAPEPVAKPLEVARVAPEQPATCAPAVEQKPKPAAPKKHIKAPKVCK